MIIMNYNGIIFIFIGIILIIFGYLAYTKPNSIYAKFLVTLLRINHKIKGTISIIIGILFIFIGILYYI